MDKLGKILIVDDNKDVIFALNMLLENMCEKIVAATQPERINALMAMHHPDIILLDMNFSHDANSGSEGMEWLAHILKVDPQAVVIFLTAYADTYKAVSAIKAGAMDFVPKPWNREKLLATLHAGMELRRSRQREESLATRVEALSVVDESPVIGQCEAMQRVFATIGKLSQADANVLLLGENGTGKDVIARMLHQHSARCTGPFVSIDIGSVPEQLFESELFGHEKGAFTDAHRAKAGRMEVASGGTLFLDEIGNLSLPMQAKMLTAIEKRCISRLGSTRSVPIDVRLVCATNADIRAMVDEGSFRQDLLYRINTIELHLPPLRERGEDVLLLARHFMERYARKYHKPVTSLHREAERKLMQYAWPGNVRELQHIMERAVLLCEGDVLRADDFVFQAPRQRAHAEQTVELNLEAVERKTIERALKLSEGNLTRAAEQLGITRYALYRKIEKLGL